MAKKRSIKVYGQSGYKYRKTPTIMLKGQWLKEAGFDIGDAIYIDREYVDYWKKERNIGQDGTKKF